MADVWMWVYVNVCTCVENSFQGFSPFTVGSRIKLKSSGLHHKWFQLLSHHTGPLFDNLFFLLLFISNVCSFVFRLVCKIMIFNYDTVWYRTFSCSRPLTLISLPLPFPWILMSFCPSVVCLLLSCHRCFVCMHQCIHVCISESRVHIQEGCGSCLTSFALYALQLRLLYL